MNGNHFQNMNHVRAGGPLGFPLNPGKPSKPIPIPTPKASIGSAVKKASFSPLSRSSSMEELSPIPLHVWQEYAKLHQKIQKEGVNEYTAKAFAERKNVSKEAILG